VGAALVARAQQVAARPGLVHLQQPELQQPALPRRERRAQAGPEDRLEPAVRHASVRV
jgi:hypothetical protein